MKVKWRYFQKTIGDENLQFEWVINQIELFLSPVYETMIKGELFRKNWDSETKSWA